MTDVTCVAEDVMTIVPHSSHVDNMQDKVVVDLSALFDSSIPAGKDAMTYIFPAEESAMEAIILLPTEESMEV